MTPRLIIHGGAGRAFKDAARGPIVRASLHSVCQAVYAELASGMTAMDAVLMGCRLLETDPNFNAGTGSAIQSDGRIRMTASIMDGKRQAFSGIVNVESVEHPIDMAASLNDAPDRVIAGDGAAWLARELGLPIHEPATAKRMAEWMDEKRRGFGSEPVEVVAHGTEHRTGTIGVVALDVHGDIVAGTSTGGRGYERVGRVSDCAMPAGNYATAQMGINCTGVGEDIIDECFAARVAVRVEDGMRLTTAMERSIDEAARRERMLGAIAISRDGDVVWGKASDLLLAAWDIGFGVKDCVDAPLGPMVKHVGG